MQVITSEEWISAEQLRIEQDEKFKQKNSKPLTNAVKERDQRREVKPKILRRKTKQIMIPQQKNVEGMVKMQRIAQAQILLHK